MQALHRTILSIQSALSSADGQASSAKPESCPKVVTPDQGASAELQEPRMLSLDDKDDAGLENGKSGEQRKVDLAAHEQRVVLGVTNGEEVLQMDYSEL